MTSWCDFPEVQKHKVFSSRGTYAGFIHEREGNTFGTHSGSHTHDKWVNRGWLGGGGNPQHKRGKRRLHFKPHVSNFTYLRIMSRDSNMQAQIFTLERQRQELLTINEKWAKEYNTMVAFYQHKFLSLQTSQRDHSDVKKVTHQTKTSKREKTKPVNSELHKAVTEAEELRARNGVLTTKWQHQQEEISRLNKALEESLHPVQTLEESRGPPGDLWKLQAQVFKEDFLKEREDRGKLQKKLSKAQDELHFLKSQATWTRILHPVVDCTCKRAEQCNAGVQKRLHS